MLRVCLIALLALGLLLPRTGAALAEAAGFERVVICGGDRLVTVVLGPDGGPVETAIEEHGPCLAAATPGRGAAPEGGWLRLAPAHRLRLPGAQAVPGPGRWTGPPPERGPPVRG